MGANGGASVEKPNDASQMLDALTADREHLEKITAAIEFLTQTGREKMAAAQVLITVLAVLGNTDSVDLSAADSWVTFCRLSSDRCMNA